MDLRVTGEDSNDDRRRAIDEVAARRACSAELRSDPLQAQMPGVRLGRRAVALELAEGPHACLLAARVISRPQSGYLALLTHEGGPGFIEENGRRTVVRPGWLTYYDTTRPTALTFPDATRSDLLLVARDVVDISTRPLGELTARTVPADRGTAAVLRSVLTGLASRLAGCSPSSADLLGSCLIDLTGLLLRECLDEPVTPAGAGSTLFTRIAADLEHRLHDPDVCPERVANAHHISVRYLSKLFAAEGTTVMGWVRERRLDKCRADLLDPRLRNRSIAAVAARWGILQPAHFSRAFRARYGVSPREYRLAAGASDVVFDVDACTNFPNRLRYTRQLHHREQRSRSSAR
jgi:AraC-like DNA-binding protein